MNHLELLKRSLPPDAYDPDAPNISAELTAEGNALDRAMQSADGLLNEFDPRTTYSLLPDWERVAGVVPAPGRRTLLPGTYGYGPSNIASFARASTATYIDANGVLQTAAANVARFQNGQLLIEDAGTNAVLYSQQIGTIAPWVAIDVTPTGNAGVAPNGTTTASLLVEDTANAYHRTFQAQSTYAQNASVPIGMFVKRAIGTRNVGLQLTDSGINYGWVDYDLTAITATPRASGAAAVSIAGITALANGWFFCFANIVVNSASSTVSSSLFAYLESGNTPLYMGDGASGLYLWGAVIGTQGSYIPTTNAPATRAADLCDVWVPQTLEQRRAALSAKIVERGGQSRGYFLALAARYGFLGATITDNYRRATCNGNCNSKLYGPSDLFTWTVSLPAAGGVFRATCNSDCNTPLQSWGHSLVEGAISDDKPAHTTVLFSYQ